MQAIVFIEKFIWVCKLLTLLRQIILIWRLTWVMKMKNIYFKQYILAIAALAASALFSASAQAGIVFSPASIVDHGSYITDTVNNLDWYKFSNSDNTVGKSYNATLAEFSPLGWSSASISQVQGLETQFGWTADTFAKSGTTDNFGLSEAMASFLGYTSTFYTDGGFFSDSTVRTDSISAMTNDTFFLFSDVLNDYDFTKPFQQTTQSETYLDNSPRNGLFFYGDYVNGNEGTQGSDVTDDFTGTWLTRTSSVPDPGCSPGGAVPCDHELPEPTSMALFALGLAALASKRSRSAAKR